MIHNQATLQWRYGPAGAFRALADATGNTDRVEGGAVAEIHVVGIDESIGVGDLAAERQRITRLRGAETTATLGDLGGETEVAHAVRRFGELPDDPAQVSKAWCTFQSGQAAPKRANCSFAALWRLVMLPARSMRAKKIGMPFCPGRCRVERR